MKRFHVDAGDALFASGLIMLGAGLWRIWGPGAALATVGTLMVAIGLVISWPRKR